MGDLASKSPKVCEPIVYSNSGQFDDSSHSQLLLWKLEKRLTYSKTWQAGAVILALLGSALITTLLILIAGADVSVALRAMVTGAFGSTQAIAETLVQATPLIFTGLAVTVAFRARVWNIGAEGQFFAGAMGATWFAITFGEHIPSIIAIPCVIFIGIICGALWAAIPGLLKIRFGTNEIISTVMLNFVILYGLSFLLSDAWRAPNSYFYQTVVLPSTTQFPRLIPGTRLNLGFIIALTTAGLIYILLWKTALGYEIRAVGSNPTASAYKGIPVSQIILTVIVISGAIAGLAGACEVPGLQPRLRLDISLGYGFTGIIIALLGRLHPAGVLLASIFFGALVTGASAMQIAVNVPVAISQAVQGVTLLLLLTADVLSQYRIRRRNGNG
ncbi:MAG: ABC transporter permease [Anaerolineae bacterium]